MDAFSSLSAIIPNYNHGDVVGTAIRALAGQSRPPDEIIVIDDGSSDRSLDELRRLEKSIRSLRVIALGANGGAIAAMNRGLKEARGRFVIFAAADDRVLPGILATLLDAIDIDYSLALACAAGIVQDLETGHAQYRPPAMPSFEPTVYKPAAVRAQLRQIDNYILTGATVFRRSFLEEAGGFDPDLGAFADGYVVRSLALRHGYAFVPQPGLIWRVNSGGLSRKLASDPIAIRTTIERAAKRMSADPVFPEWYPELFRRRLTFAACRIACDSSPSTLAFISDLCGQSILDRGAITATEKLPAGLARRALLLWLFLRLWPMAPGAIVSSALWRRKSWPPASELAAS